MHSIPSVRTYVIVWAILTIMTFVTFYVAQINLGQWNVVIALLIAFFKMSLVIFFFMNLKAESPLTKLFAAGGFFWMALLLGQTFIDYVSRNWMPLGKMW
ncbi:MAG TPA: cytochrome C oxidase subunit IV family protein [Bryobacteraceae bacterium]|jgi:cytochrome c oxidase subunit IV|nr:cytochrome C oxidase subunit IV family protein [Bryobacteraceae bacterium]